MGESGCCRAFRIELDPMVKFRLPVVLLAVAAAIAIAGSAPRAAQPPAGGQSPVAGQPGQASPQGQAATGAATGLSRWRQIGSRRRVGHPGVATSRLSDLKQDEFELQEDGVTQRVETMQFVRLDGQPGSDNQNSHRYPFAGPRGSRGGTR